MTAISTRGLGVRYRATRALNNVSVDIPVGKITGIIGPNGSGKSTMMKAMLSLVDAEGSTTFFDKPLDKVRGRIGYMPQTSDIDWDFPATVQDVVTMGTYGSLGWIRRPGKKHKAIAQEAMERVQIANLAQRQIGALSGGQRRRVFLARMLAQQADLFMMDEPFAGIDAASEKAILEVLTGLNRDEHKTIVIVHHHLGTVREICDNVILLQGGNLIAEGDIDTALTDENLAKAYEMQVHI